MKTITKIAAWIVKFVYKVSGIKWVVDEVSCQVMAYKLRLRMVPLSYKMFLVAVGFGIGASGMYVSLVAPEFVLSATRDYEQVNPLIVKPVEAKEAEVKEVKRDLADYIWMKESTRGKNNYSKCEAIGKINGIGYAIPGNGSYICFDSHEDEMIALNGWITVRKASGWSELKMLCTYSGNNYEECKQQ